MSISTDDTKALSRHFLSACVDRGLDEDEVVKLLPIKSTQAMKYWVAGVVKMQQPSVDAIRILLDKWGVASDPSDAVNAYMMMASELSPLQRWDLVTRILESLQRSVTMPPKGKKPGSLQ